jgi:hypothetical protein
MKYYQEVLDIEPNDTATHLYRGMSAFRLGRNEVAKSHFKTVKRLGNNEKYSKQAQQWLEKIEARSLPDPTIRKSLNQIPEGDTGRQSKDMGTDTQEKIISPDSKDDTTTSTPERPPARSGNNIESRDPNESVHSGSSRYRSLTSGPSDEGLLSSVTLAFSLGSLTYDAGQEPTFKPTIGNLMISTPLLPYYSIEGRVGLSNRDTQRIVGIPTDVTVKRSLGLYNELYYPFGDWLKFYGLLGYGHVDVEICTFACSSASDGSLSYGSGFSVFLNQSQTSAVTVEWLRYFEQSSTTISGINFGVEQSF